MVLSYLETVKKRIPPAQVSNGQQTRKKKTKGHALNTCLLWPTCQMTFEFTFVLDKIQKNSRIRSNIKMVGNN